MTTFAPATANASAIERPTPFVEPVISAECPLRSIMTPHNLTGSKTADKRPPPYSRSPLRPARRWQSAPELRFAASQPVRQTRRTASGHEDTAAPNPQLIRLRSLHEKMET